MKSHSLVQFFIYLVSVLIVLPAMAQCPDGKSEITIITGNGISKTQCINDKAIQGIENAPDHAVVDIETACPCLDVWDGHPYPEGTSVTGVPPALPDDLAGVRCHLTPETTTTIALQASDPAAETYFITWSDSDHQEDGCAASSIYIGNEAVLRQAFGGIYPQEKLGNNRIDDPGFEACRKEFESRGCEFF